MVGQQTLNLLIQVRALVPQPITEEWVSGLNYRT